MRIEKIGSGKLYPEVQEIGTKVVLIMHDQVKEFDCAVLQKENPVHIDIMQDIEGGMVEGLENGDKYIANIQIPPARYIFVPSTRTDVEEGAVDREQCPFLPSDMAAVRVILWPISEKIQTETQMMGE